ncbi:MAG: hypothetical protein ACLFVQ_05810 [Chitinispirillaceae bacterium]
MDESTKNSTVRQWYPKQFSRLEKKREEARKRPLTGGEITTLLSMRFNGEAVYGSIEDFYSEKYRAALESGASSGDLEEADRYRAPTQKEINLLYCDVHARDEALEYSQK